MDLALKIGSIIDGTTGYKDGSPILGKKFNSEKTITTRNGLLVDGKTLEVKNDLKDYYEKNFELVCITEQKLIASGVIGTDPVRKSLIEQE